MRERPLALHIYPCSRFLSIFVSGLTCLRVTICIFVGALCNIEQIPKMRQREVALSPSLLSEKSRNSFGSRCILSVGAARLFIFSLLRKGLYVKGMTMSSLSIGEIIGILQTSRAVFDFPNHAQCWRGYTRLLLLLALPLPVMVLMRFIENMCTQAKDHHL